MNRLLPENRAKNGPLLPSRNRRQKHSVLPAADAAAETEDADARTRIPRICHRPQPCPLPGLLSPRPFLPRRHKTRRFLRNPHSPCLILPHLHRTRPVTPALLRLRLLYLCRRRPRLILPAPLRLRLFRPYRYRIRLPGRLRLHTVHRHLHCPRRLHPGPLSPRPFLPLQPRTFLTVLLLSNLPLISEDMGPEEADRTVFRRTGISSVRKTIRTAPARKVSAACSHLRNGI